MNILDFKNKKLAREKISMVTCYDFWSAQIINQSKIDTILVGDSLAMVVHGHPTTLPATLEIMCYHVAAVARGAPDKFIVADMPFMSFRKSLDANMTAIEKLMQAGGQAVKLEGATGNLELIRHTVDSGVPVMGHLGLTPQSVHQLGGFRVQGREDRAAQIVLDQAHQLEQAGCFALVLEAVPASLAARISEQLEIPTIGIGAGSNTDGQVLVLHDLLGLVTNMKPKFVRQYMNGAEQILTALNQFHGEVETQAFPTEKESYL